MLKWIEELAVQLPPKYHRSPGYKVRPDEFVIGQVEWELRKLYGVYRFLDDKIKNEANNQSRLLTQVENQEAQLTKNYRIKIISLLEQRDVINQLFYVSLAKDLKTDVVNIALRKRWQVVSWDENHDHVDEKDREDEEKFICCVVIIPYRQGVHYIYQNPLTPIE